MAKKAKEEVDPKKVSETYSPIKTVDSNLRQSRVNPAGTSSATKVEKEKPAPVQTYTEILQKSEPAVTAPPPKLDFRYDFLRMPLGLVDFENAGVLFKNPGAPNNEKLIAQYNGLLAAGYTARLCTIDNNYVYFQFEKQ